MMGRLPDEVLQLGACTRPGVDLAKWLDPRDGASNRSRELMESACADCPLEALMACRRWAHASGFTFSGIILGGYYFAATGLVGRPPPWDAAGARS
jgi:hypothetical protein